MRSQNFLPMPACSPHRSYWVAARHLCRLVRHQRKAYLQLSEDSRIPVSRRRLNDVRKRVGFLNQPAWCKYPTLRRKHA